MHGRRRIFKSPRAGAPSRGARGGLGAVDAAARGAGPLPQEAVDVRGVCVVVEVEGFLPAEGELGLFLPRGPCVGGFVEPGPESR